MSVQSDTYRVIRSKRKTISIEVNNDLEVIVRAPKWVSMRDIRYFVDEKENWIRKAIGRVRKAREANAQMPDNRLSESELSALVDKAKQVIPERVTHYASLLGVSYGRITIRHQKTRWGSCSSKGNLNFNCLLMLAPEEHRDYVIVHELCHRFEMNHSKAFWANVASIFPDYRERRQKLKEVEKRILNW